MSSNWQYQLEKISERAKNILQTGLWSDCAFIVGIGDNRKVFKAHKLILSMSSAVFDAMFNGPLKEENPDKIEVVDIQPEAFASLLKYIYTDEIEIHSFDQACELCYVAKKYLLPTLVQHCIAYIWKDINPGNACRAYEFAKLFDQDGITEDCKKIIVTQTSDVLDHPSFQEIEKDTLLMILNQDELNIKSEKQLFQAVEKWIEAECERKELSEEDEKQQLYSEIICNIRFLSMSPQDFAEGPALSTYLSKEDSYAIIMNLVTPKPPIKLPAHFSERTRRTLSSRCSRSSLCEVTWQLRSPILLLPSTSEITMSISCDKDIEIFGIKIIGNASIYLPDTSATDTVVSNCDQKFTAFIEDTYTTSVDSAFEKNSDGYREYFYLRFQKPYLMEKGKFHKFGVKYLQPGLYTKGLFDYDSLMYKSLRFMFDRHHVDELQSICGILCNPCE